MPFLEAGTRSKDKTSKKYKPSIKKFFIGQTRRILERYNEYFNLPKLSGDDFISPKDVDILINFLLPPLEDQLLSETIKPVHTSGIQKSVDDVNNIAGSSVSSSLANAQVASGLQVLGSRITRINATTRLILKDVIETGIEEGTNIFGIANNIQDTGINEFYKGRSLAIARTETRIAYDIGGRIAYRELGVQKFDVVGCVGTLSGVNEFGYAASYGDFSESVGSCGVLDMPMNIWDAVSSIHHVNHAGVQVAAEIPVPQ